MAVLGKVRTTKVEVLVQTAAADRKLAVYIRVQRPVQRLY